MDAIKLAPQLAASIGDPEATLPLIQSVLDIARRFNVGVIASGIEHELQRSYFRGRRVSEAQGFGICPPLTGASMLGWLRGKDLNS